MRAKQASTTENLERTSGDAEANEFKALVAKVKKSADDVRSKIQSLDAEIAALNEARKAIDDAPVSKNDYMEYLRADIARMAARMPQAIKEKWARDGDFRKYGMLERIHSRSGSQPIPYINGETHGTSVELGPSAFYWYFGDLIAERFDQVLEEVDWPQDAMPVVDRRKRVAEIDSKIDELSRRRSILESNLRSVSV